MVIRRRKSLFINDREAVFGKSVVIINMIPFEYYSVLYSIVVDYLAGRRDDNLNVHPIDQSAFIRWHSA